jgi:hypothetical protein
MHAKGNDSDPGFRGFQAGTRGKAVVSGEKTPENGRKVEAVNPGQ